MLLDPDSIPEYVNLTSFAVTEKAPSHRKDIPCFSSWEGTSAEDPQHAKGIRDERPMYSIQIYDTTPDSNNPKHVWALALELHQATFGTRMNFRDPESEDRLDVYGLPMSTDTSDDERVNRCIAHQKAEIESRHSTGRTDFYISGTCEPSDYRRFLLIIDGPVPQLDGGESGATGADSDTDSDAETDMDMDMDTDDADSPFMAVFWDQPEEVHEENLEQYGNGWRVSRVSPDRLGTYILCEVKTQVDWFYNTYVYDNLHEKEVARYARRWVDERVDPGQEGLLEMERYRWPGEKMDEAEDDPNVAGAAGGVAALRMNAGP
ncbi:uncharacterized protein DNG_04669 [Cephalotrichum gorgonifer]|uniref:Uncharacterized protein n=1 Tax=Cephalotrichum gorgonifer TaxID=2041049 RepID=A0AAE8SUS6_9PEZI|nr:uncharacterized protein DNG_04669 [Cephalotrichum gorgonifer]